MSNELIALLARIEKLENERKDYWDKLAIITPLLMPASIAFVGYFVSAALKDAEIESAYRIAVGNQEVAKISARVDQANLVNEFLLSLTEGDIQEKKLAARVIVHALPSIGPELLEIVSTSESAEISSYAGELLATIPEVEGVWDCVTNEVKAKLEVKIQSGRVFSGTLTALSGTFTGLVSTVEGEVGLDGGIEFVLANSELRRARMKAQAYSGVIKEESMSGTFVHDTVDNYLWGCTKA